MEGAGLQCHRGWGAPLLLPPGPRGRSGLPPLSAEPSEAVGCHPAFFVVYLPGTSGGHLPRCLPALHSLCAPRLLTTPDGAKGVPTPASLCYSICGSLVLATGTFICQSSGPILCTPHLDHEEPDIFREKGQQASQRVGEGTTWTLCSGSEAPS